MGYAIGVGIVVVSLFRVTLQVVVFRERSQHIEGLAEAKKRYAGSLVFSALLDTTWIFLLFLILAPWALRGMRTFSVDWQIQQEWRQVARFEQDVTGFIPDFGEEADWEAERSKLVAQIQESVDGRLDSTCAGMATVARVTC